MHICIELPLRWYNKSYVSYTHIWPTHQILNVLLTDVIPCSVDRTDEMRRGGCRTHLARSNLRPHVGLRRDTVTAPPRTTVHGWGDHGRRRTSDHPLGVLPCRRHHLFIGFQSSPPGSWAVPLSLSFSLSLIIARTFFFTFSGCESFTLNFFQTFIKSWEFLSACASEWMSVCLSVCSVCDCMSRRVSVWVRDEAS